MWGYGTSSLMISAFLLTIATVLVPNPEAFHMWRPMNGYTTSNVNLQALPKVQINCEQDQVNLYPTHPQQESKEYHLFDWGQYNHFKLHGESEACAMSSRFKSKNGQYACLRPDVIFNVVMSDIYRDKCGNFYRGFKHLVFLKKNENMGTLLSVGRTIYPNPKSNFPGDTYVGPTYPVLVQEFVFLSNVLPGDLEKTAALKAKALARTHSFDEKTLLFSNN